MNKPLVSIGLPTYNRANDLQACLANLINLDYKNIEIIISDNHSTDATPQICQEYVKKDKRVRYYRQQSHLPGEKNFIFVVGKTRGKYFFLASDDDIRGKTYVSELIPLLEQNPKATTAITDATLFTKNQSFPIPAHFRKLNHPLASFFTYIVHPECVSVLLYGIHRRSQLFVENFRQIMNENRPFGIQGYDNSLAVFLLLQGDLLYFPKKLLHIRDNGLYLSVYQQLSEVRLSKRILQRTLRYVLFPVMFLYDWYYGALHICRAAATLPYKLLFWAGLTGKLMLDNVRYLYSIVKAGILLSAGLIRKFFVHPVVFVFRKINRPQP